MPEIAPKEKRAKSSLTAFQAFFGKPCCRQTKYNSTGPKTRSKCEGQVSAIVHPDVARANRELVELHAHAARSGGLDRHAPDARALGCSFPVAGSHRKGRQGAPYAGLQPGAWLGQAGHLGLAERSQRELPRLTQSEPHARRARLDDAGGTIRAGITGRFLARDLLRPADGSAEPGRAHRDQKESHSHRLTLGRQASAVQDWKWL